MNEDDPEVPTITINNGTGIPMFGDEAGLTAEQMRAVMGGGGGGQIPTSARTDEDFDSTGSLAQRGAATISGSWRFPLYTDGQLIAARRSQRQDRTVTPGIANFGDGTMHVSLNDSLNDIYALAQKKPKSKVDPMREERLQLLKKMTSELLDIYYVESKEARNNDILDEEEGGRREREYLERLKIQKMGKITASDYLSSEHRVPLQCLSTNTVEEMLRLSNNVKSKKGNIYCSEGQCQEETPIEYMFATHGYFFCAEHAKEYEECGTCSNLSVKEELKKVLTFDERQLLVCSDCIKRNRCRDCSEPLLLSHIEIRRCERHMTSGEGYGRRFSYALKWVEKTLGEVVKSKRMFSSEIEAYVGRQEHLSVLSQGIPRECGIGSDGSLITPGVPFEIQTPRLGGKKGEELLNIVCGQLKSLKADVNDTCGMHIHLDAVNLVPESRKDSPKALKQLWKAHLVFEDVILSFIPYKRRSNDFCRPMRDAFNLMEVELCDSIFDLEKLWYKQSSSYEIKESKGHHYHSSRYFGVNLHSLFANQHLEIRYHSGTTNARKILEWANLHALIMDAAVASKFTAPFLKECQSTTSLHEKTQMLFELLKLEESGRQYFYARQKKFSNKKEVELQAI